MQRERRKQRITFLMCGLLLFTSVLGCKMLGKKSGTQSSTNKNDNPFGSSNKSGDALTQKTNLYIKECVNKYSNRVMDSYQRYASWLHDVEAGPTGKENLVYGLYDISGDGEDCIKAINKAKSMDPSLPDAEASADAYANALQEVVKQIKAIYPYYDHEDYKDDGFQRGKEAHASLLAAFKNFEQADKSFDAQVDKLEDEVANTKLRELKDDPARKYDYEVVETGVKAKNIMKLVKQTDYSQIKVEELQPLIDDFEKSVDALKSAGAKKTMSSFYISGCDNFLKAAKELMRRVRDKQPFSDFEKRELGTSAGWMVDGSRDKLIRQYNEMIQRRGLGI